MVKRPSGGPGGWGRPPPTDVGKTLTFNIKNFMIRLLQPNSFFLNFFLSFTCMYFNLQCRMGDTYMCYTFMYLYFDFHIIHVHAQVNIKLMHVCTCTCTCTVHACESVVYL